ncbi:MAG: hypothetical protein QXS85_00210 [Acidilobaceae archaeon]
MKTLGLSIVELALATTMLVVLVSAFLLVVARIARAGFSIRKGGVYVGGEDVDSLSRPYPNTATLYWGFTARAFREAYVVLRDSIHSGKLSDWAIYMASWYIVLLVLAIIAILVE